MPHDFNLDQPMQLMPLCPGMEAQAYYRQEAKDAEGEPLEWTAPVIGFAIVEAGDGLRCIQALVLDSEGEYCWVEQADDPAAAYQCLGLKWRRTGSTDWVGSIQDLPQQPVGGGSDNGPGQSPE